MEKADYQTEFDLLIQSLHDNTLTINFHLRVKDRMNEVSKVLSEEWVLKLSSCQKEQIVMVKLKGLITQA